MAASSWEFMVLCNPACLGRVWVWMGKFTQLIWELIWKFTTIGGIGGRGVLPSSVGRISCTEMKCGPKSLVPGLGPGGGPWLKLMLWWAQVCVYRRQVCFVCKIAFWGHKETRHYLSMYNIEVPQHLRTTSQILTYKWYIYCLSSILVIQTPLLCSPACQNSTMVKNMPTHVGMTCPVLLNPLQCVCCPFFSSWVILICWLFQPRVQVHSSCFALSGNSMCKCSAHHLCKSPEDFQQGGKGSD